MCDWGLARQHRRVWPPSRRFGDGKRIPAYLVVVSALVAGLCFGLHVATNTDTALSGGRHRPTRTFRRRFVWRQRSPACGSTSGALLYWVSSLRWPWWPRGCTQREERCRSTRPCCGPLQLAVEYRFQHSLGSSVAASIQSPRSFWPQTLMQGGIAGRVEGGRAVSVPGIPTKRIGPVPPDLVRKGETFLQKPSQGRGADE